VLAYALRRLLSAVPALLGGSAIIFLSLRILSPVDLIEQSLSEGAAAGDAVLRARLRSEFGLDQPLPVQYVSWLWGVVRGDLGTSWMSGRPVIENILSAVPVSLEITLLALALALLIGLPIGVLSAVHQNTWVDYVLRFVAVIGLSVPSFVVATVLLVAPSIVWGWSPPVGYKAPWENFGIHTVQMLLPLVALAVGVAAVQVRLLRSSLLDVLRNDYVRTGRAKGLAENTVISRHALRNCLIPMVTLLGTQVSFTLGGSVVLENIFSLPGLGRLTLAAIEKGDFPQLQANILYLLLIYLVMNLLVDLSYAWLDPRIRYS
jgi:peptide/nickel transport system permease protein